MKKSLLATVAAAALFASSGLVVAQGGKDQPAAKGGAEGGQSTGQSGSGAQGERGQGGQMQRGQEQRGTTGQGGQERGAQSERERGQSGQMQRGQEQRGTTGQGQQERGAQQGSEPRRGEPQRGESQRGTQQQGTQQQRGDQRQQNQTTGQGAAGSTQAGGSVNLTSEQKTKIRTSVIQSSSAPKIERSKVNFNISVGTVVPRTINLVAVPPTLVEIHPAWRGYRYFIVDEEIIIVEPSTFKIIAVVHV
jgi:hypothetical protein